MAQVQVATNEAYGEMGRLIAGLAANAVKSVICLKTACCALEACVAANLTNATESGLTIADATITAVTTAVVNDTVQLDHSFNAQASATIKGFACFEDNNTFAMGICCFAADVPLEVNDLLNVQFKWAISKD